MRNIFCLLCLIVLLGSASYAQTPVLQPDTYFQTIIGIGPSYDNIAKPGITAGFLQGILLTSPTSAQPIYSFTLEDFSPVKGPDGKTHWQSAVTTGVASLLRMFGNMGKLWILGTVGGGTTSESSGLAWSAGGAWTHGINGNLFVEADFRILKIANGDNQGRFGIKICLGSK